jgi:hypothetical protein
MEVHGRQSCDDYQLLFQPLLLLSTAADVDDLDSQSHLARGEMYCGGLDDPR